MRELSGEQQTERKGHPYVSTGPAPNQGKGWLWHGFAALGISALGLAVATVIGLTTNAQTTEGLTAVPEKSSTVDVGPVEPSGNEKPPKHPALAAFDRRETAATNDTTRSAAVRLAIVNEQAAQRDELLAKTADKISRAAETANSDARQRELRDADQASRKVAAQIAAENLRRAIAARVAAANKRRAAESQPSNPDSPSATPSRKNGDGGGGSGSDGGGAGNSDRSSSGGGSNVGSSGGSASPVPGAVIGAGFGEYGSWSRYHTGIDFRAAYGTPIRAVKSGVVLYAGNSGDWAGIHVAIKHADGKTTMSSHMSSMAVRAGQTVQAGQIIGRVGETGRAFGAHLHFELYPVGVKYGDVYNAINPQPWLAANGVTTH